MDHTFGGHFMRKNSTFGGHFLKSQHDDILNMMYKYNVSFHNYF